MDTAEREKKKKYLHTCLKERQNCTPFVPSVNGIIAVEAEVTLECLARLLATKWKEPYSCICGYQKGRVEITAKI